MIDVGSGSPIVLIPGIQGRWEWLIPTVGALSRRHRVLSFSLHESARPRPEGSAFDAWMDNIDAMLDRAHLASAAVIGVSFGGLIAMRDAARRPARVSSLVLVSAPSPSLHLDATSLRFLRFPQLALPAFSLRAARRLLPETLAARQTWGSRAGFLSTYMGRVIRYPMRPGRSAAWVREWLAIDLAADCRRVAAPTLLITGEPRLDRVVPVASTLEDPRLIRGSRHEILPETGHIGLVSRPHEFARIITAFVEPRQDLAAARESVAGRAG